MKTSIRVFDQNGGSYDLAYPQEGLYNIPSVGDDITYSQGTGRVESRRFIFDESDSGGTEHILVHLTVRLQEARSTRTGFQTSVK